VLNHCWMVGWLDAGLPTRSGLWFPPNEPVLFAPPTTPTGKPDLNVLTPVICQPPSTASVAALKFVWYFGFYSRICGWDWGSSGKFAGESVGVNVNPSASDGT